MDTLVDAWQGDPWATHVPTLTRLGGTVRSVLELGCGRWSTPLFLDRATYPRLERLVSVENDRAWAMQMPEDSRLTLVIAPSTLEWITREGWAEFDLIFIDNGPRIEDRIDVIGYVARHSMNTRVVLHDYEDMRCSNAAREFEHIEVDDALTPWTAVAWNGWPR